MGEKVKGIINKIKFIVICIYEGLLEIIYPHENYCIICLREDCNCICHKCKNNISRIKNDSKFIKSYGYYSGTLKKLLLMFKFNENFTAGEILAHMLAQYIKENYDINKYVLTYIPITNKVKKKRGFNQCEYLSKVISKELGIEYAELIIKVRETKEQKTLSSSERAENIVGAFKLNKRKINPNKGVILIDDVVTTGATLMEAYKILCKNNIKDIKLLTLAKSTI